MRIVYVADFPMPARAANCIQSLLMCEALAAAGHEVRVVALDSTQIYNHQATMEEALGRPFAMPITSVTEPTGRGRKLRGGLRQLRVAAAMRPDLVYSLNWAHAALSALCGFPTIFEAHVLLRPGTLKSRLAAAIFARSKRFLRLVATSRTLANDWMDAYGFPRGKLVVAYNGAEPPPPAVARPAGARLRVGYTGFLYPGKGMEVIAQIAPRCPEADFHIAGGPDERVQHWRQQLAGCGNVFLHGPLPHSEIAGFQRGMDVLLAPYQEEVGVIGGGMQPGRWITPMKVFEYMGAGGAIVASDLAVAREVIRDGDNGLLVPPTDVDGWVRAVQRLNADPPLRERLAAAAARDLSDHYTWAARARIVLADLDARSLGDKEDT